MKGSSDCLCESVVLKAKHGTEHAHAQVLHRQVYNTSFDKPLYHCCVHLVVQLSIHSCRVSMTKISTIAPLNSWSGFSGSRKRTPNTNRKLRARKWLRLPTARRNIEAVTGNCACAAAGWCVATGMMRQRFRVLYVGGSVQRRLQRCDCSNIAICSFECDSL